MITFHSFWTLALFLLFIGIVIWAWSSRQKKRFEEAANLPLIDDEIAKRENNHG